MTDYSKLASEARKRALNADAFGERDYAARQRAEAIRLEKLAKLAKLGAVSESK
jgi:hypothetical protein